MSNKCSVWLNITGVICYFMGIACLTTLILIPLAIYCFIGGSRYFTWANLSDIELSNNKKSLRNWAIFVSIVGFPVGLISIIPFIKVDNNPVVTDVNNEPEKQETKEDSQAKADEMGIKVEVKEEPKSENGSSALSKEETIAKLQKFKEDGLITEAEYKRAVSELKEEK